jgi:ribose transport system ATP-binding protein
LSSATATSAVPSDTTAPLLRVAGVSKSFGAQRALIDLDLELRAGEICALIGENGSGKSTFIKILGGYHRPEPGARIEFRGRPVRVDDPTGGWRHHLRFIHQDLGLIPTMSVLDNIALVAGYDTGRARRINWRRQRARARQMLDELGLHDVDVQASVARLSPVERTLVALARVVIDWQDDHGLIVLDEPTTALSKPEVAWLFVVLRELIARGAGVLFVSHRLDETLDIADRVVVLRDGRKVADRPIDGLGEQTLLELMIGGAPQSLYPTVPRPRRDEALVVRHLSGARVRDVSLTLHRGEILGVAGVAGSGREQLPDLLYGTVRAACGEIIAGGRRIVRPTPRNSLAAGVALVPRDRVHRGVLGDLTAGENITLADLRPLWRRGRIDRRAERADVGRWVRRVSLRPEHPDRPILQFSGGNQQKAVLARWLRTSPRVLLLDEPVQGVDVGAKRAILALVAEAAGNGMAIVICSSDANDLAEVCDRVAVMRAGEIVRELQGERLTAANIVAAALTRNPNHPGA